MNSVNYSNMKISEHQKLLKEQEYTKWSGNIIQDKKDIQKIVEHYYVSMDAQINEFNDVTKRYTVHSVKFIVKIKL